MQLTQVQTIQALGDCSATTISSLELMASVASSGKRNIALSKLLAKPIPREDIQTVASVEVANHTVTALENGTIQVFADGKFASPAKPILRKLAASLGVDILNSNGNPYNTRQLTACLPLSSWSKMIETRSTSSDDKLWLPKWSTGIKRSPLLTNCELPVMPWVSRPKRLTKRPS